MTILLKLKLTKMRPFQNILRYDSKWVMQLLNVLFNKRVKCKLAHDTISLLSLLLYAKATSV